MKYVDEFRDPEAAKALAAKIKSVVKKIMRTREKPLQLMEFCGGHTHTLFRYNITSLLPDDIEMVHGPGCPVCVLPMERVDDCIAIAELPNVILATFGDAMRVPGTKGSLLDAKARGCDIRMVYSPLDALEIARKHPTHSVVFFALGFETTMPSTALTVLQAARENLSNFSLFCNHITTAPTLEAILKEPDLHLDGFLAPGHVSMVVGSEPFEFVANDYHKPIVITGFEPVDILQSLLMLVTQILEGRTEVENQYGRVVKADGNHAGLNAMQLVYEAVPATSLRGFGQIDRAGICLRDAYQSFDAERRFSISRQPTVESSHCQCGDVLKGIIKPWQCQAYGKQCQPATPLGALMVSSEGACAAYFNHGYRIDEEEQIPIRESSEEILSSPNQQGGNHV